LISPEGEFGGVVQIMNQLNAGNVVSFNGDRAYGFDTVDVPFVGGTAKFPFGAFQIAAAAGVPILVLLASKTGPREYTIDVTQTIEPIYAGRRDKRGQLSAWVAQYAAMLDAFFAEHPFQCFLFYDVWINTVK